MKAVRGAEGGVVVVDVEEPPGTGELLTMKAASICSSDLMYIDFGFRKILGHELAGVREDGTARVVEALYGCMECDERRRGRYNLCASGGRAPSRTAFTTSSSRQPARRRRRARRALRR